MTGRPAFDRPSYIADIRALRARGATVREIARQLAISRATVYRIIADEAESATR